jgi:hypothetical protein
MTRDDQLPLALWIRRQTALHTSPAERPRDPRTLEQAITDVEASKDAGTTCPCCGLYVRRYRRALGASQAAWLCWLVRAWEQDPRWYEANECRSVNGFVVGGDYAKVVYWGLAECKPAEEGEPERARNSGPWRPTEKGIAFVRSETNVWSHVYIFDGQIDRAMGREGFAGNLLLIRDVLGTRFDYDALMGGTSRWDEMKGA